MPASVRASAKVAPLASSAVLSAARGGTLSIVMTGITGLQSTWLAVGPVVGGPPATYADLVFDVGALLPEVEASMTITFDQATSEYTLKVPFPVPPAAFAPGDEVWVALFTGASGPPSSGDAPDAVAGPFTVIA